jgi:RimJ/RimL family protein N-acetyltransferase
MNYNIFQGEKIRLRARTMADIDPAAIESGQYDTESDRLCDTIHLPQSHAARKDGLESEIRQENVWDRCTLVIETLDGTAVGSICTTHADRGNGTFSYGVGIRREFWRNGYAAEAIRLFLNYYFNELRFHKCNIGVYDYNAGSMELHRSLGFVEEGRLRESRFTDGRYHDLVQYGITADEFNRTR